MNNKELLEQLENKIEQLNEKIGVAYPTATDGRKYLYSDMSFWTKGFWPGMLWHMYQYDKKEEFADTARKIEEGMDEIFKDYYMIHHDAGFVWSLSAVADYKLTGNEASKRRGLMAANLLAGRFNCKGNFIRAWNSKQGNGNVGWAIIDCMMNLPILYWASGEINDPRYKHIAMAHADMVTREYQRADGSNYHIVCFDPETGLRIGQNSGQGAREDSAWSRGQAWMIYGMALSYRYTKESRYLRTAMAAADYFIRNLPQDYIPYWDFKVDIEKNTPRDTSAAGCAACGLLELTKYVIPEKAAEYKEAAEKIVQSLHDNWWLDMSESEGLIGGATGHYPKNSQVMVSLIYGDYFYTEAVMRLNGDPVIFW